MDAAFKFLIGVLLVLVGISVALFMGMARYFTDWTVIVPLGIPMIVALVFAIRLAVSRLRPRSQEEGPDEGTLREEAMSSIKQNVDAAHYTQAITLIIGYSKRGFLRPELVLDDKIKEKMAKGKTKEQAIEELYNETQA
jgi:hypothetical protein